MIVVGGYIPDVFGLDQNGELFRSTEYIGKKNLVVFFYPKDFTPGCTAEACAFRDSISGFAAFDAEIIGISGDDANSHRQFADAHNLNYRLVSDAEGKIREAFGIPKKFGFLENRITFIFDKKGILRKRFSSQFFFAKHVEESLESLRKMDGTK